MTYHGMSNQFRHLLPSSVLRLGHLVFPHVIHIVDDFENLEEDLRITKNLYDTLQGLKMEHIPRTICIDALCINQDGPTEKSYQVAHIGQIYSQATHAIVWLGTAQMHPRTTASFE